MQLTTDSILTTRTNLRVRGTEFAGDGKGRGSRKSVTLLCAVRRGDWQFVGY
jgi:hypothetical protein